VRGDGIARVMRFTLPLRYRINRLVTVNASPRFPSTGKYIGRRTDPQPERFTRRRRAIQILTKVRGFAASALKRAVNR